MVERGDATPEDIDTAMKLGAGHPMGPFGELLMPSSLDKPVNALGCSTLARRHLTWPNLCWIGNKTNRSPL